MKTILFITLFVFCTNANAQITLAHTYDSASNFFNQSELMLVKLEVSGERYIRINMEGKTIDVYNINHSILKSISFAGFPPNNNGLAHIIYFSENLFNTDSKMEFMYVNYFGSPITIVNTSIYNEDGNLIFRADSMAPLVTVYIPQQQFPIYNTSQGTKMILSHQFTGQAKVYSLPGTLSNEIAEANNNLLLQGNISNAYPNPAINTTRIDYKLPDGINQGEIVFYDLQGKEIKRYRVDTSFDTLLISTDDIAAGTYFYQLQTTAQSSEGKKMVVIK